MRPDMEIVDCPKMRTRQAASQMPTACPATRGRQEQNAKDIIMFVDLTVYASLHS